MNRAHQLLDHLPLGCCLMSGAGTIRFWNRQLVAWTGLEAAQVVGKNIYNLFPQLDVPRVRGRIEATAKSGTPAHFSSLLLPQFFLVDTMNGQGRVQQTTVVRSVDAKGNFELMINVTDMTEQAERADSYRAQRERTRVETVQRQAAEAEVAQRTHENEMRQFALDAHAIVSITDTDGYIIHVNQRFCQISGYHRDELLGQTHAMLKSDQHDDAFFAEMWRTICGGKVWQGEIKNRSKDGNTYWVDATIVPFTDSAGVVTHYVAIRTNITQQKAAEAELAKNERLLKQVIDAVPVQAFWKDREGVYLGCNRRFAEAAGLQTPEQVIGKRDDELLWSAHAARYRANDLWVMDNGEALLNIEQPSASSSEPERWVQSSKVPLTGKHDEITGLFGCYNDITERKLAQLERENLIQELSELKTRLEIEAVTDPLSGLFNRRGMNAELNRSEAGFKRWRQPFSVVLCDLDHFKRVNDTYGHEAGDLIIKGVADVLRSVSRSTDIVARWGGEEFLLLLPKTGQEGVAATMERVRRAVEECRWRFQGKDLGATMSLGGCTFDDENADLDAVIGAADQALYEAKDNGRNGYVLRQISQNPVAQPSEDDTTPVG